MCLSCYKEIFDCIRSLMRNFWEQVWVRDEGAGDRNRPQGRCSPFSSSFFFLNFAHQEVSSRLDGGAGGPSEAGGTGWLNDESLEWFPVIVTKTAKMILLLEAGPPINLAEYNARTFRVPKNESNLWLGWCCMLRALMSHTFYSNP